jgi:hypothetical protein
MKRYAYEKNVVIPIANGVAKHGDFSLVDCS